MNKHLFISDFKRMTRQFSAEALPEVLADYVERIPYNPDHAICLHTADKDKVIGLCCEHFKVSLLDMIVASRKEGIRHKRQVTIYLLETRTYMNQTDIGNLFHRDRSTVAATKRRIQDLIDTDITMREEIAYLNAKL